MAEADQRADRDEHWKVRFDNAERLKPDVSDDEEIFCVEFELQGPGVSGTLSALVTDPASEETIVTEALDLLLVGLEEFATVVRQSMKPIPTETAQG